MPTESNTIGLLLSGGLDSCILLSHLLATGHAVRPIHLRSDLVWQRAELRAVQAYLRAVRQPMLGELVVLDLPLADLYVDHWSTTGKLTPDEQSPDEAVYLPGRNALLFVKAAVWCQLHGIERLALGTLSANPFADATTEFFERFQAALSLALSARLQFERPLSHLDKRQVMQLGRGCPLEFTFSCIAPIDDRHCGCCNKCAERKAAFTLADLPDPTPYAARTSLATGRPGHGCAH